MNIHNTKAVKLQRSDKPTLTLMIKSSTVRVWWGVSTSEARLPVPSLKEDKNIPTIKKKRNMVIIFFENDYTVLIFDWSKQTSQSYSQWPKKCGSEHNTKVTGCHLIWTAVWCNPEENKIHSRIKTQSSTKQWATYNKLQLYTKREITLEQQAILPGQMMY